MSKKMLASVLLLSALSSFASSPFPTNAQVSHDTDIAFECTVKKALFKGSALSHVRDIGPLKVHHEGDRFSVETPEGDIREVQPAFLSKELRGISTDKLAKMVTAGAHLGVKKSSDGNYSIDLNERLKGGGAFGAFVGCWIGKTVVYVVGYGTITLVSGAITTVSGPGGVLAGLAMKAALGAAIESASNVGAFIGGTIVGVSTGPL